MAAKQAWVERLKQSTGQYENVTHVVMYSVAGASFQQWALRLLDRKGSLAHRSIGKFVTAIDNGTMTIAAAEQAYLALLKRE